MIEIRGMAWDHPRGYEPLIAASEEFGKLHPGVLISWDVRSLKEFGDMPIEVLIERYDLITIDHPYMGQADRNELLVKLEEYVSNEVLKKLERQSVGPSFESYSYADHIYALPIDAAALVAAFRKDKIEEFALKLPETRDELKRFYRQVPLGYFVAWALCPTDFWCAFLTFCAQESGTGFLNEGMIDRKVGSRALDEIKFHLEYLHPESMKWNPIQILDAMGNEDGIIYAPYLFGYTNYAREGYTKSMVHFANSPVGVQEDISTILGGVGLAVSAKSIYREMAVEFAEFVASADIQEGLFTKAGGQPGNVRAWESESNNVLCNGFFRDTIRTLENAYVRPQHVGWNSFQEAGADLLHEGVLRNVDSGKLMDELNELYRTIV